MTLTELKKFCAGKDQYEGKKWKWQEEPFKLGELICATDGHTLVAQKPEPGVQHNGLQELTSQILAAQIRSWIETPVPETQYSTEHLAGFLGPEDVQETWRALPMMFHGQRVDRNKLRKIVMQTEDPYRYAIVDHMIHLVFPKFTALLMGMKEPHADDPRYEPKELNVKTSHK